MHRVEKVIYFTIIVLVLNLGIPNLTLYKKDAARTKSELSDLHYYYTSCLINQYINKFEKWAIIWANILSNENLNSNPHKKILYKLKKIILKKKIEEKRKEKEK